jgi:DMSO reductase family type II enzyme heme b subunit
MRARYVSETDLEALRDPESAGWKPREALPIALMGTPLGMQPSEAIRVAWSDRRIGAVDRVRVAAAHDGRELAFHLEWADPTENGAGHDNDQFPDAAAVLLPSAPGAPLITMGQSGQAVNAWYWRADQASARNIVAEGLGTSRSVDDERVRARGVWKEGHWRVVIARALRVEGPEPVAQLRPGESGGFGVAVWDGGSGERAGIKSFSGPQWIDLQLDGLPSAGR